MINIGICFEADSELFFMKNEVCKCFNHRGIVYNIYCFRNSSELRHGSQKKRLDVIFFDAAGEHGLILKTVMQIKEKNRKLISIIFKSANLKEALDKTRLEPIYTVPGKSRKRLWEYAFLAYETTLDDKNTFSFYNRPLYIHIPFDDISYFASEGRRIRLMSSNENPEEKCTFYKKLNELEKNVSNKCCSFIRIHQSYLINEKYVEAYNRDHVLLSTGEELPISKYSYYKTLCDRLASKKVKRQYSYAY